MFDFSSRPTRMAFALLWKLRKAVKWLAVPLRINDRLIESCQVCGVQQPMIWHAPHALWAEVVGTKRDASGEWAGGVYCPRCFDQRASDMGMLLVWVPMPHGDDEKLLDGSPAWRSSGVSP